MVRKTILGFLLLCFVATVAKAEGGLHYGRHLLQRPQKCQAISLFDFFGNDIRRIEHVFSWQRCCALCKREHGCKGYTWRSEFKHCWLKHTLANYQYCANCYTQDLFIPVKPKCHPTFNYGYFGGTLRSYPNVYSYSRCCDLCIEYKACKGWTWHSNTKRCFLKSALVRYSRCPTCVTQSF